MLLHDAGRVVQLLGGAVVSALFDEYLPDASPGPVWGEVVVLRTGEVELPLLFICIFVER